MKLTMKFLVFISIAHFSLNNSYALTAKEMLADCELATYSPQKAGLRDVVFQMSIENLNDMLKKNKRDIGEINEIGFTMYWADPQRYDVEVNGPGKDFVHLKKELAGLALSKFEYILPKDITVDINSYDMKLSKKDGMNYIDAEDKSGKKMINRIEAYFDENNLLKKLKTWGVSGSMETSLSYIKKSWSGGKWAMSKIENRKKIGKNEMVSISEIDYDSFGKIGLPERIKITNFATQNGKKVEYPDTVLKFKDYQVNLGISAKRFKALTGK